MNGLEELRRRYPWPAERPNVPEDRTGWFGGGNQRILNELLSAETKVVVELGSLLGMSSTFLCEHAPHAAIICVDHWRGSQEHVTRAKTIPEWAERLRELYERFLRNMWPWRNRLIPMRTTTLEGLQELAELSIEPDLIYVDAAHDTESVANDVATSMELFPQAELVGDDWTFPSVRLGVCKAAMHCRFVGEYDYQAWHIPVKNRH